MVYILHKCLDDVSNPPVFHDVKKYNLAEKHDTTWKSQTEIRPGEKIIMPWFDEGIRIDNSDIWRVPKRLIWTTERKRDVLPQHFSIVGMHIVSDQFRQLVEKFDPEIYQFFPIEFYCEKTGETVNDYGQYYIWNPCIFIGAWDLLDFDIMMARGNIDQSPIYNVGGYRIKWKYTYNCEDRDFLVKTDRFYGRHIAYGHGASHPIARAYYEINKYLYCSDAFHDELIKLDNIGFKPFKCQNVGEITGA